MSEKHHIAFNSICQSNAADMMKERFCAAVQCIHGTGIEIVGVVHDELLFQVPEELARWSEPGIDGMSDELRWVVRDLVGLLESPAIPLRVPVRCSFGVGDTWAAAGKKKFNPGRAELTLQYDKTECANLEWLKA